MRHLHDDDDDGGGSATKLSSWTAYKNQGKQEYERGQYQEALQSYNSALHPSLASSMPAMERQIILSNMVACRLKIGGRAQAEAAVENAKQCIAVNEQWAKGHVRLASAYIALGEHSNDACNSLQRALQLDPRNPTAREMLMKELRRDRNASSTSDTSSHPGPSAPPEEEDISSSDYYGGYDRTTGRSYPRYHDNHPNENSNFPTDQDIDHDPIDDNIPLMDRFGMFQGQAMTWYQSRSDNVKAMLKVILVVLVLYVAFGGRFGLEYLNNNRPSRGYKNYGSYPQQRGNYEAGNAYDEFYSDRHSGASHSRNDHRQTQGDRYSSSRYSNDRYSSSSSSYGRDYGSYNDDHDYYGGGGGSRRNHRSNSRSGSSSFHLPNLFDGSIQSMAVLMGIAYMCHRNGINPLQALFFMNMMGGRRRGFGGYRRRGFGFGGGGFGFGGGGFGGRRNMGYGRPGGRWF